jgi:proline racemase
VTTLVLEAPAGLVRVTAECSRGKVDSVTFENVPSFCSALDAVVEVPGLGTLTVDVAYGGAWCAFVDATALGFEIVPDEARALAELGERIRPHATEQLTVAHPVQPALSHLSFIVFVAPPRVGGDARHATVVSPGRLDRAPTGTATSARIAVLDRRGVMGATYVAESVLDTRFTGRIAGRTSVGDVEAVVPAITGRAWITGFHQLVLDPTDPLAGFKLPDTWGPGPRDGTLNVE